VCWSDKVKFHIGEDGNPCHVTYGPGKQWEDKESTAYFQK